MDERDREAIAEAVRDAEGQTAGEIVVMIDRAAASYRMVPVAMALTLSLLVPWPLLAMTETSAPRIFLIQLVCAVLLLASLLWYGRGGRFVPGFVKRRRAHDVALREFTARGLSRTRQRTGVLLYVAIQERYAEIIADSGIDGRVEQAVWDGIVEAVVLAGREDRLREGIVTAVRAIGAVLANHAPRSPDDIDELPNNVVIL
ncbi:MAG TPA: TPM domain-containing protein [Bosea sp. (in: a-proteobacteria)]|jgi:putative membrane protein|uniref:TPM domain-containing protein n=1 Tax=Bosea sp. (in: a-proteobacteria) TaxID=1871050 RepID=UPI002DDCA341|nr:TPM domain-containing protein [Bosea sp. (in: a-proteobacteria)]HEV2555490.1 TPM domain-containing protein [Bosea sp. (in: a-proteobacteria)]